MPTTRAGWPQASGATQRNELAQGMDSFVQEWTGAPGDTCSDRIQATQCMEAALINRQAFDGKDGQAGILDFSSCPFLAFMQVPVELMKLLDEVATLQKNPLEIVILPPKLARTPRWLGKLVNLKRLVAPEFAGDILGLGKLVPNAKVSNLSPAAYAERLLRRHLFDAHSEDALARQDQLSQDLYKFVDEATGEPGDSIADRQHAVRCIEAVVADRDPSSGNDSGPVTLNFGNHNPACMNLPSELIETLNAVTELQKRPVKAVILPPGLKEAPSWLEALPHLEQVAIAEVPGNIIDRPVLPELTLHAVQRPQINLTIEMPQQFPWDIDRT